MRVRTLIAIGLAFVICIGASALWSAGTTQLDEDPDAAMIAANGSPTGSTQEKKKGNKVARFFSAPFRAVGKLFGRGKDENKIERLNEKDVARFETAGLTRIDDANSPKVSKPEASADAAEHFASGRALFQSGRTSEAIGELSLAVSLDPSLGDAYNLLGMAFDKKGMPEKARESYERALKTRSNDPQILNNLGFSLYTNGNYRAAVDKLKKAAKYAPYDERILNNLALAQVRLGKFEDAYKSFVRAGGELTGTMNVATMLDRAGRNDEAINYYEMARKLSPGSSVALNRLADLYERAGRYDEARQARRDLDELAAGTGVAKN
jgi:Flp pilus assembly protein TadD